MGGDSRRIPWWRWPFHALWRLLTLVLEATGRLLCGALGLVLLVLGGVLMLSVVGFEPNAVQSEETRLGMRALFSVVPGCCYLLGTLAFLRFRLGEGEHAAIRRALDERAALS